MSRVAIAARMVRERNPGLSAEQAQARLAKRSAWEHTPGVVCARWTAERVQLMLDQIKAGHALGLVAARLGVAEPEVRRKLFAACDASLAKVYRRS